MLVVFGRRWWAWRTLLEAAVATSAAAVLERLERPLVPGVVFSGLVGLGVAVAAAEGRMVKALSFEVGDPVPEGGGLVVVAYVGHGVDC